jgi:hypothetical protein
LQYLPTPANLKEKVLEYIKSWPRQGSNPEALLSKHAVKKIDFTYQILHQTRSKTNHHRTSTSNSAHGTKGKKRQSTSPSKEQKLIHRKLLPALSVYGFGPHLTRGCVARGSVIFLVSFPTTTPRASPWRPNSGEVAAGRVLISVVYKGKRSKSGDNHYLACMQEPHSILEFRLVRRLSSLTVECNLVWTSLVLSWCSHLTPEFLDSARPNMVHDRFSGLDEHGFRITLLVPALLLRARKEFDKLRRSRETKV